MADAGGLPAAPAVSVALSANHSLSAFQRCLLAASAVHPRELSMVEDQLARFSTWASSIGVFAPGRASMDHRLRCTSDVQGVVMDLLDSLSYRIEACTVTLQSISGSPEITQTPQLVDSFANIANEISHLNKISNTIRKASKETQHLRVSDFQIKDDEDNDIESLLLAHFKHYVDDLFPGCSETLKGRLSSTMLLRRKRILYRRHRQGNTSIRLQETMLQAAVALPSAQSGDTPSPRKHQHSGVAPSQIMTATTLASKRFKMASASPSVISASKTVALVNHQALAFPSAPGYILKHKFEAVRESTMKEFHLSIERGQTRAVAESTLNTHLQRTLQEIGEIACPYCLYALPAHEVFEERRWQQHVKNDLDPYICMFEDCNSAEVLYSHSQEWLAHLHDHGKIWHCSSHPSLDPFTRRDDYIQHIRDVHSSALNDAQIRALANKNSRKRANLFPSCPLCGAEATDVSGRMEDHITGHLRSLALKSLPAYEEDVPDGFMSTENSEQPSNVQSRSTIGHTSFSGDINEDEAHADASHLGSLVTGRSEGEPTNEEVQGAVSPQAMYEPTWELGKIYEGESHYEERVDDKDLTPDLPASPALHKFMRAFHPFDPTTAISGSSVTPPLEEGDVILIHSIHVNGWADGTLVASGARGWIPTNYCEPYEPEDEQALLEQLLNSSDIEAAEDGATPSNAAVAPIASKETDTTTILQETKANLEVFARSNTTFAPVHFKDAIGRKFSFPFHLCSKWAGMEELIKQAFMYQDSLGPQVHEGLYDLLGPEGEIILPPAWDQVIQPGWSITMTLWPPERLPSHFRAAHGVRMDHIPGLTHQDESTRSIRDEMAIRSQAPSINTDSLPGSVNDDVNEDGTMTADQGISDGGLSNPGDENLSGQSDDPPRRCPSCDHINIPEWRSGPDGSRTLCNACGLDYAEFQKQKSQQEIDSMRSMTKSVLDDVLAASPGLSSGSG